MQLSKPLVFSTFLLYTSPILGVGSSGITNQVVGARAFGMANSFVAQADDPSAVFFNPAGLTQLEQTAVSFGFSPILVDTEYNLASGGSDNSDEFFPVVPNFYAAIPTSQNWAFGIGVNSPFGLESHWSDTGPLRFVTTDAALLHVQINPSAAYKINEKISVGGGLVYAYSQIDLAAQTNISALNTVLNGTPTTSPEGHRRFIGDGDQWGYNFGILLKSEQHHRLGLSYRSELKTKFKGDFEFNGLTGTASSLFGGPTYEVGATTELDFPQTVIVGYAFTPGKWTFEIDGEWVDYSTVDETRFVFSESNPGRLAVLNADNPVDRDWHNTWNLGLGTNYAFNSTWEGRAGFLHYPRAIPTDNWDPIIGESSKDGFTLGGTFKGKQLSIDGFYSVVLFDERTIVNNIGASSGSSVNGTYKTVVHLFGFNFTYRFKTDSQT